MLALSTDIRRLVLVRLNPGDDILLSLRKAVADNNIQSGAVVSGVGSLSSYHVHVVKTTNMPPGDEFFGEDGPFDILTVTGLIIAGRVHAHITFANTKSAMGGHLEEGCQVLTFSVIVIAETPDADYSEWDRVGNL
jgi:predicted DNA-binding protein with PD1-like motif